MTSRFRPNDKVRILSGELKGERALVLEARGDNDISVRLTSGGQVITVADIEVINFSDAARRAWETMPERRVGRPKTIQKPRVSVTLRIDKDLWSRIQALEANGAIASRSELIEELLESELQKRGA